MPSVPADAPANPATSPDAIDPEALRQVRLLDDERVERVWKTTLGFLVMTNLRCTEVTRRPRLFVETEWEAGPTLFFYNLAPPRVLFHHILELSEDHARRNVTIRFLVHDPHSVAEEIEAARVEGQHEWLRRRARVEASLRQSRQRWGAGNRVLLPGADREVVRVRCRFCGSLIEVTAARCRFCGAPQG